MKTTGERPLLAKKSCQDAAYLQLAGCRLDWPIGYQVHIPLHRPQQRPKALCKADPSGPSDPSRTRRTRARPWIPSQAGTSCKAGASTARSRDGQPSPSGIRGQREPPRRSRRRFPSGPSTQALPPSPVGHRPSRLLALQGGGGPARSGSLRIGLSHALAESKADPPSQPPLALDRRTPPKPAAPRQTPLSGSHLVGAHPPCSRKGPLLPACGPKSPWRVKREATNSRFVG